MQIFGNILVGLASFIYLLPLQLLLGAARRATRSDGSGPWGGIFVFLPLWLLLTLALSVATARGGLDWLPIKRGGQHALVLLAGLALLATSLFAFFGRIEHATQLPFVSRPFLAWADLVLPLVTIAFLILTLNAPLSASVPAPVYRLPFAVFAGVALLHGVALLGEWAVRAQQNQVARLKETQDYYARIDREQLERLQTLDPEKDLAELLSAAALSDPQRRAIALEKLQRHPRFVEALAAELGTWRAEAVLEYLAAHDVAPESKPALAQPAFAALASFARRTATEVDGASGFDPVGFARRARMVPAVAGAFANQGLDFAGIVREFRRAIGAGSKVSLSPELLAELDRWLAAQESHAARP